jgi:hypothetical protein
MGAGPIASSFQAFSGYDLKPQKYREHRATGHEDHKRDVRHKETQSMHGGIQQTGSSYVHGKVLVYDAFLCRG